MRPELAALRLMDMDSDRSGHLAHPPSCAQGRALPRQKLARPETPQSRVPGSGAGKLFAGDLDDRMKRSWGTRYGRSSGGVNSYIRGYL